VRNKQSGKGVHSFGKKGKNVETWENFAQTREEPENKNVITFGHRCTKGAIKEGTVREGKRDLEDKHEEEEMSWTKRVGSTIYEGLTEESQSGQEGL